MIQRNLEQERIEALAERQANEVALEKKRQHELKLAEMKLKYKPRIDGRTKVWTTALKAPVYPVALICLTILTLREKPVPQVLTDFLR